MKRRFIHIENDSFVNWKCNKIEVTYGVHAK